MIKLFLRKSAHKVIKLLRIGLYQILSDCQSVSGKPFRSQPVLLKGQGHINFGEDVHLGVETSPFFYSGYMYIEARNPETRISIGSHVWINNNASLIAEGEGITIGDHTLIGTHFEVVDSDFHDIHPNRRMTVHPLRKRVDIGTNVFIGANVKILKGVTIGDNSVIGNGAVVTSSIPANSVAVGCPARVIKALPT